MSEHQSDENRERRITTDRETIRSWAEERDAVPAYREDADEQERHRFFRRGEVDDEYQERNWDTFFDDFESNDRAFVYHESGDASGTFDRHEIVARDEAAARATVADRDVEERLVEGETVTTEVTERTVVEREVVETETIASEVVDSQPVDSRLTTAELVDWEVVDTDVDIDLRATDVADRAVTLRDHGDDDPDYADLDLETTVTGDVTAEVEEHWRLDREVDERLTVESRVIDVDVDEEDRVTDDTVETSVDAEGVERSIVESDLVGTTDTDVETTGSIDTAAIETTAIEGSEDLLFESHLVERRRYEDEITRRKRVHFDVAEVDVLDTETVESALLGSDVVEVDYEDDRMIDETRTDTDTGATTTGTTGTSDADRTDSGRVTLSEDDEGKRVVDDSGTEVGRVVDVEGDTLYVDANRGFFERLEAALGWESRDDDSYPITSDQIDHVDDRQVVLRHAAEANIDDDR